MSTSGLLDHYWSGRAAWPMASQDVSSRPEVFSPNLVQKISHWVQSLLSATQWNHEAAQENCDGKYWDWTHGCGSQALTTWLDLIPSWTITANMRDTEIFSCMSCTLRTFLQIYEGLTLSATRTSFTQRCQLFSTSCKFYTNIFLRKISFKFSWSSICT